MNPLDNFQHYQLLRREDGRLWELGRGAMGVTYKAFDTNLRCPVALKVINAAYLHSETARARFLREARAAAALRHRNVAGVHHLCGDGEAFFYAMEFIDGETVEAWVRRVGRLPVPTALRITLQVARALGAAHKRGLLHRDIKPANLMVVHEDDDEHFLVKLIDFGLARTLFGADSAHPSTATVGGFVGTPLFASPEQLQEMELDTRSDIYSLGVTLWFMLTGRPPFSGTLASLFQQHVHQEPPWDDLAGMPEPVGVLMRHLLQKHPAQRPQNPAELRVALTDCLRAVLAVTPPGAPGTGFDLEDEEGLSTFSPPANGSAGMDNGTASPAGAAAPPAELAPGLVIAGRFQLTRLVGEGSGGRVFQAADQVRDGLPVAVKVLNAELLRRPGSMDRLAERIARLRAAPSPHLVQVVSLERDAGWTLVTTEWVEGFTLTGLLRKRGTLSVAECLRLLRQVTVAVNHAREHQLDGLELAPHQVMVHLPDGPGTDDGDLEPLLRAPLTEWPAYSVKIDALGAVPRDPTAQATWWGEITRVPDARNPVVPSQAAVLPADAAADLRAVGALVYELLSGSPTPPPIPPGDKERETRQFLVSSLGESGNAILRRSLGVGEGFATAEEFYSDLARATGFDPATLRAARAGGSSGGSTFSPLPPSVASTATPLAISLPAANAVPPHALPLVPWKERFASLVGHKAAAGTGVGVLLLVGALLGVWAFTGARSPVAPSVGDATGSRGMAPAAPNTIREATSSPGSSPQATASPLPLPTVPGVMAEATPTQTSPTPSSAEELRPVESTLVAGAPSSAPATVEASAPASTVEKGTSETVGADTSNEAAAMGNTPVATLNGIPPAADSTSAGLVPATADAQASPTASPGGEAKEDAPGERRKTSTSHRRSGSSHSRVRRTPVPQPNLIQRIFGIKPKPKKH